MPGTPTSCVSLSTARPGPEVRPVRIGVVGAGGVGGYFGGRLADAGEDVVFIARGAHLDAMRSEGLRVDSVAGDFLVRPVSATDDPREVGPVDAVLLAVKAWQVPEVARAIDPMIGPGSFVVPLENGVEAPEQLSEALGSEHVLGGLCAIISFISGPGHITHSGYEPFVAFGELDNRPSDRAVKLREAFERAGVVADIPEDIHVAMWRKFLYISGFSGVATVAQLPAGGWRSVEPTRALVTSAFEEVYAIARAAGIQLPSDAVGSSLAILDSLPEHATASMQRDIADGKPSELEAQTGAVVRLGLKHGVPTPVNDFIYAALAPREKVARTR